MKLKQIILKAKCDSFNAGYDKKMQRIIFCKKAREEVIQQKINNQWLCLHK
jgi:hypothetical protein